MFTDIHALAPNLVVIEGRHLTLLWEACDVPSIVVYRGTKTLYVLDTGVGPEQRAALEAQVAKHGEGAEEIVLVNSHGHFDHLGNNDLLQRSAISRKRHLISRIPRRTRIFAGSCLRCTAGATSVSDDPSDARLQEHQVGRFLSIFEERLARRA